MQAWFCYNGLMQAVLHDALWGSYSISEAVLVELIESGPVQRLKGIHQAGASYYLLPDRHPFTRFEHSLGVMRVLEMLGASLEECVAGLLHDVPHTVFSHTVDTLFPSEEHNFHERFQHDIVMQSSIPDILERYGVPLRAALEPEGFALLEQPLPDLCADRLDYSLRALHGVGRITSEDAQGFIRHLVPTPQGIVVDSAEAALWYARLFAEANDALWTGPDEAGAYWALAGAMRRAYALGAFTDADLFSSDEQAMGKLRGLGDAVVDAYLRLLIPGTHFYKVNGPGPYFTTSMKQRAVDPWVLEPGWRAPERLSALSSHYAERLRALSSQGRTVQYRLWSDAIE